MKTPPTFGVSLLSLFMYAMVLLLPVFIILGTVITYGLVGSGSNYAQGVISYYPSPDAEKVIITAMKSPFSSYNYILDKNGGLITDLGRNAGFLNQNLIWRPSEQQDQILYEEEKRSSFFGKGDSYDTPMTLFNIKTNEKTIIKQPYTDVNNCHVDYGGWSEDGKYLFGTKFGDTWQITSIFRQNVITGDINEKEIAQAGSEEITYPLFLAHNIVLLTESKDEGLEEQAFVTMDLDHFEDQLHKLPPDTVQWEVTPDGKALIVLKKLFKENMVDHQIIAKDLDVSSEEILMESPDLPQFSFEDAARGKDISVSIELSPLGQWTICTSEGPYQKTVKWLINLIQGTHYKLLEYDSNKAYIDIIFSQNETRLCVIYSLPVDYDDNPDTIKPGWIVVYDINDTEPNQINHIGCDKYWYDYKFLGDNYLLYIKGTGDYSWWKNKNELWKIDIIGGSQQRFIQLTNLKE
jgi:hypothetical protein